jgi:hypothetical protein
MEVIRKNVRVDASRRVTVELPEGVAPGEHDVLVVIGPAALREEDGSEDRTAGDAESGGDDSNAQQESLGAWLRRTSHKGRLKPGTSLRREDIYGDEGR